MRDPFVNYRKHPQMLVGTFWSVADLHGDADVFASSMQYGFFQLVAVVRGEAILASQLFQSRTWELPQGPFYVPLALLLSGHSRYKFLGKLQHLGVPSWFACTPWNESLIVVNAYLMRNEGVRVQLLYRNGVYELPLPTYDIPWEKFARYWKKPTASQRKLVEEAQASVRLRSEDEEAPVPVALPEVGLEPAPKSEEAPTAWDLMLREEDPHEAD